MDAAVSGTKRWQRPLAAVVVVLGMAPVPLGALVMGVVEGSVRATIGGAVEAAIIFAPSLVLAAGFVPLALGSTASFGQRIRQVDVVVLLGLLQTLAWALSVPATSGYDYRKGAQAALRSDLANLLTRQDMYAADNGAYTTDREAIGFVATEGVEVRLAAGPGGWSAVAEHVLDDDYSCALFSGDPTDTVPTRHGRVPPEPRELFCQPLPPFTALGPVGGALRAFYDGLEDRPLIMNRR